MGLFDSDDDKALFGRLDQAEDALIGEVRRHRLSPGNIFLLGMRWKGFREAVVRGSESEAEFNRVITARNQLLKRLGDAGITGWEEQLNLCAAPARSLLDRLKG